MTAPAFNTVAWFQVGTDDPDAARRFYGRLFGWTFQADPNSDGQYDLVSYPGAEAPSGGITNVGDKGPKHATFLVLVENVESATAETERLGGAIVTPPTTTKNGLVFADLLDPAGNQFGVFTPPPTP